MSIIETDTFLLQGNQPEESSECNVVQDLRKEYTQELQSVYGGEAKLALVDSFFRSDREVGMEELKPFMMALQTAHFRGHLNALFINVFLGLILVAALLQKADALYKTLRKLFTGGACNHTVTNSQNAAIGLAGAVLGIDESVLVPSDILNLQSLITKLNIGREPVAEFLNTALAPETSRMLPTCAGGDDVYVREALARDLDRIIHGGLIYDEGRFAHIELSPGARRFLDRAQKGQSCSRANRALLESAFPEISPARSTLVHLQTDEALRRQFSVAACLDWMANRGIRTYTNLCHEVSLVPPNELKPQSVVRRLRNELSKLDNNGRDEVKAGIRTEASSTVRLEVVPSKNHIITPEEAAKALEVLSPQLVPFSVLKLFGGVRTEEGYAISWEEIRTKVATLVVEAEISKLRQRRAPPLQKNALQWLLPFAGLTGPVNPGYSSSQALYKAMKREFAEAGVVLRRNTFRNCYISYRLAQPTDSGIVADEAGTSKRMVESNYKALATQQEAQDWFSIAPSARKLEELQKYVAELKSQTAKGSA